MNRDEALARLPGGELVERGLADLRHGRSTIPANLLEIARTRLARAGLLSVRASTDSTEWELRLYRQLRAEGGDAYSRYNALLRELNSFLHAIERQAPSDVPPASGPT